MKIDMRPEAIGRRLRQVRDLRRLCLSLARSGAGRDIARRFPANPAVRRTGRALGR
ncbi:MAG: hypothetical protein WC708_13590 [Lentisphaeria bacterium]